MAELRNLISQGYIRVSGGKARLTAKGSRYAAELGLKALNDEKCVKYMIPSEFVPVLNEYKKLVKSRPNPVEKYDQGYIGDTDAILRLAFMYERGDLEGASVLILGDDDMMGIAFALTNLPKRILVLDIDKRIIEYEKKVAAEKDLRIEAKLYDASQPLDKSLRGKFDVFLTDPVETLEGIKVFLSRCASAIKANGAGYFGVTHLEASLKKWLEIEKMLISMNLVITDILRDFSIYPTKDNIGLAAHNYPITNMLKELGAGEIDSDFFRSSFFRVEAIDEPKPLIKGKVNIREAMYKDDESLVTSKIAGR